MLNVGEYKVVKVKDELKVKQLMGIKDDAFIYALFKNNCIELRTNEQYELLLKRLDKKIQTSNDNSEAKKYEQYKAYVIGYSRTIRIYGNGRVHFIVGVIDRYDLRDGAIIEKCSDCIKMWNPNIFKIKRGEACHKRHRR